MLRKYHWLICTFAPLICGIAPFASDAQVGLTDHATEQSAPRYTTLNIFGHWVVSVSINNHRMVTGSFLPLDEFGEGESVGFALQGRFLDPIDVFFDPKDVEGIHVTAIGNNDRGEIVGLLSRSDREIAFRYSRGKVEDVSVPGANTTTPRDINNRGDMVGVLQFNGVGHGYLLSGDRLTLIDGPDSDGTTRIFGTIVFGLNEEREVVGCYEPRAAPSARRGFVFREGIYEIIHVPGAQATCTTAINNRGQIVGGYSVAGDDRFHGFLFSKGRYVTMDIPNVRQPVISSINDLGDIVGTYVDESDVRRGFKSNIREFIHRRNVQR